MRRLPVDEQRREVQEDRQRAVERAAERATHPPKGSRHGVALAQALRDYALTPAERGHVIAKLAASGYGDGRLHPAVRGLSVARRLQIAEHLGSEIGPKEIADAVDRHELNAAKDAIRDIREMLG